MKFPFRVSLRPVSLVVVLTAIFAGSAQLQAEPIPLPRAIELALAHSSNSVAASADVQRAFASYREIRNNYVPQLNAGSGLGWSYGFPLSLEGSAPALVNVVAQSTVFNPAQSQFMKAARTEWQSSQALSKDQRNATIQDVAVTYAELAKWEARLSRLQQDEALAQQMEKAVSQRLQEGVDSPVDLNKAKLGSARVRLHLAEARGSADVLRRHLATLTALPVSSIEIAPDSIPALPSVSQEEDLPGKASAVNPAIQSADQHALAESFRALGEHRALLPSLDLAAQYARLATFNNYDQYYKKFQPDNATIGISIRLPIFNSSQRARAQAADAEAVKAKAQAAATRNQVSEDTLKLQRAVEQLAAAREVADLEYEVAQSGVEASQTRVDAGSGTLHELADARAQANDRFLAAQDAGFEYQRARLALLRATGELEKWALAASPAK